MSNLNKVLFFVKETAEYVVKAFNLQVERAVRLVKKPPKKPPLSWDSIIGEDVHRKNKNKRHCEQSKLGEVIKNQSTTA